MSHLWSWRMQDAVSLLKSGAAYQECGITVQEWCSILKNVAWIAHVQCDIPKTCDYNKCTDFLPYGSSWLAFLPLAFLPSCSQVPLDPSGAGHTSLIVPTCELIDMFALYLRPRTSFPAVVHWHFPSLETVRQWLAWDLLSLWLFFFCHLVLPHLNPTSSLLMMYSPFSDNSIVYNTSPMLIWGGESWHSCQIQW